MSNYSLIKNNIIPSDLEMRIPSNNNIIKNIPSLVEQNLIKKIAKINNINFKTGIKNEIPIEPSQYELLCKDIKDTIIQIIRNNLLFIILIIILSIGLTYRYYSVKNIKEENRLKEQAYLDYLKEQQNKENKLLEDTNNNINELDNIRSQFKFYDDNLIKKQIIKKIYN